MIRGASSFRVVQICSTKESQEFQITSNTCFSLGCGSKSIRHKLKIRFFSESYGTSVRERGSPGAWHPKSIYLSDTMRQYLASRRSEMTYATDGIERRVGTFRSWSPSSRTTALQRAISNFAAACGSTTPFFARWASAVFIADRPRSAKSRARFSLRLYETAALGHAR